jgi:hypothetical protein
MTGGWCAGKYRPQSEIAAYMLEKLESGAGETYGYQIMSHLPAKLFPRLLRVRPTVGTRGDLPVETFKECLEIAIELDCRFAPYLMIERSAEHLAAFLDMRYINRHYCCITILSQAVRNENVDLVRSLLEARASPNIASGGRYPLHDAILTSNIEVVGLLMLHGANPDLPDRAGHTVRNILREMSALVEM